MKRKYGYQSKTVRDQIRDNKRPYLSLNDETGSQGEYFLGNCLQVRSSPSKNFGALRKKGKFWDK